MRDVELRQGFPTVTSGRELMKTQRARIVLALGLSLLAVVCVSQAAGRSGQSVKDTKDAEQYRAMVTQYCVTCHNERAKTGGVTFEKLDFSNIAANADIWEKAVRKLRVGMMPPQGSPQPDTAIRQSLVSWLTAELDQAAAAAPNPGRPLLHHLNRFEYGNAIRDLLALDIDPAALLPPDDAAYGFDNVGDVLGMSPVLLERYMGAAGAVSALAVGDPDTAPSGQVF